MNLTLPEEWLTQPINIKVAGVGGTGSQVIDQLASLDSLMRQLGHPGFRIKVYDADTVSRFNLGRQRFAAPDIGLNKAVVLCHRVGMFYGTNIVPEPKMLTANYDLSCDLLITCTDSASFRARVGSAGRTMSTDSLWLDFGNGSESAQCVIGHLGRAGDPMRIPNVFDLFPSLSRMDRQDREQPSCSMEEAVRRQPWPANRTVAIAGVALLERLLRHGKLTYHGSLIQLDPYSVQPLPIDPVMWAMYGYHAPKPAKVPRPQAA